MRIRKLKPADATLDDEEILSAAKISGALAHPLRIRMLRYILSENLAKRTVTNKDLVNVLDYAQATISQHLSKLIASGLLDVDKIGTSSCYIAYVDKLTLFYDILGKIDLREKNDYGGEMPDFLREELFRPEDTIHGYDDEVQLNYFDASLYSEFEEERLREL